MKINPYRNKISFFLIVLLAYSKAVLALDREKRFQMTVPDGGGIHYIMPFKAEDSYSLQIWRTPKEIWLIKLGENQSPGSVGKIPNNEMNIRDIEGALTLLARRPFARGGNTRIDNTILKSIRSDGMVEGREPLGGCFKFFPIHGREIVYFRSIC